MNNLHHFTFDGFESSVHVRYETPRFTEITADIGDDFCKPLVICYEHTIPIADSICDSSSIPRCIIPDEKSARPVSVDSEMIDGTLLS